LRPAIPELACAVLGSGTEGGVIDRLDGCAGRAGCLGPGDEGRMLRIGELARLAETTVRAVRHYHAVGLLPEPERDHSGYRRYSSVALLQLLRVRRMRALGLPPNRSASCLICSALRSCASMFLGMARSRQLTP
jgi:hypothetical protein